jgi:cysteinyl-tRNA synthetase
MQSEPLSNFRPDEIATVKLGRITELLPLALRPDQLAPEPMPFSEQELARTVDQILEASEAIRAANARAAEAEARAAEFEARAREVATLATEELKAAEARNRAMEERALAAEARAEEAEMRAGQTDAWLKQIHKVVATEFHVPDQRRSAAAAPGRGAEGRAA